MIVAPIPARTIQESRNHGGDCSTKRRFRSRKYAAHVASDIERDTGEPHEYYHCDLHHCWHTGHPIGYRRDVGLRPIERHTDGVLAGCEIITRKADRRGMLPRAAPRVLSSGTARGRQPRP